MVVVAPLIDVDDLNGPTEFEFGSHVNMGHEKWWEEQPKPGPTRKCKLAAKAGSIVVFDLRIRHRGSANR